MQYAQVPISQDDINYVLQKYNIKIQKNLKENVTKVLVVGAPTRRTSRGRNQKQATKAQLEPHAISSGNQWCRKFQSSSKSRSQKLGNLVNQRCVSAHRHME